MIHTTLQEAKEWEDCRFFPESQAEIVTEVAEREGCTTEEAETALAKMAHEWDDAQYNRGAYHE